MDAAFGMEYLHSKNIVHFDLKCDNLLVNMRDPHRPVCKVDVFSFGIAMGEILTGDEPYAIMHCGAIIGGILKNTLRPPVPERCDDPEWRYLMEQCWSSDPDARPSFIECAQKNDGEDCGYYTMRNMNDLVSFVLGEVNLSEVLNHIYKLASAHKRSNQCSA